MESNLKSQASGIVLVNKPVGISSNSTVNVVKHALNAQKAGHLGTLDLEGEGLLPVTVNSATKLFDYFLSKDKCYETVFVFGFETDTLDMAGNIVKEKPCNISLNDVEKVCKKMLGKQLQMPPMYSAKKVAGKVAYKEALKGNILSLQPKEIEIFDIKVMEWVSTNTFKFQVSCSSGTYIRSLCRDMAEKLGTYGTMKSILRTKCGKFDLKDACTLDQIKNGDIKIISCQDLFDYNSIILNKTQSQKILNGMTIMFESQNGEYKVFFEKQFLGVGKCVDNKLKLSLRLV